MFLSSYSNFSYSIEKDDDDNREGKFTVSSNDCKEWAEQGCDLLGKFIADDCEYNGS
jgi:hypothetical protein